jgi:hypothetical protein
VCATSENDRQRIYRSLQQSALDTHPNIPTYVDLECELPDALARKTGVSSAYLPELVRIDTTDVRIIDNRGETPVWAGIWADPARDWTNIQDTSGDPSDVPVDSRGSWFRRAIAMVVRGGIIPLDSGRFHPQVIVWDNEFSAWLRNISPSYESALSVRRGERLSRERAITATIKALFGNNPVSVLAGFPPPAQEITEAVKASPVELWEAAFRRIPGSENVTPGLRPYLTLALASGLLYDEPSLHARWPLTRQVAAWLLAHPIKGQVSGLLVDATDVAFEKDLRFGSNTLWCKDPKDPDAESKLLYAQRSPEQRLPLPPAWQHYPVYPAVLNAKPGSSLIQQRIGENPLVVRAQNVEGPGARAQGLLLRKEDAEKIVDANKKWGILDFWRVAIVSDVGAKLLSPSTDPASREAEIAVRFSVPMDSSTMTAENIWLAPEDSDESIPAQIEWDGKENSARLRPADLLKPATKYKLVLRTGLRSAQGENMTEREGLSKGVARQWLLTTENMVYPTMSVSGAQPGSPIYVNDSMVGTAPGPVRIRAKPGILRVRVVDPQGAVRTAEVEVKDDGPLVAEVTPILPEPARVVVKESAREVVVGDQVQVSIQVVDAQGQTLAKHKPVVLGLRVTGGQVSVPDSLTVTEGSGNFSVWSGRPCVISLDVQASDPAIPVSPGHIELKCRRAPPEDRAIWSRPERHTLFARGGAVEIVVVPSMRRWFAKEPEGEVRVVDVDGTPFTQVQVLPGRGQFRVGEDGCLYFHPRDAGRVVAVSYQYRRAPCATVFVTQPDDQVGRDLAEKINDVVRGLLVGRGYTVLRAREVSDLCGEDFPGSSRPSRSKAESALDLFNVSELFVFELSPSPTGGYLLGVEIWSAGPTARWSNESANMKPLRIPARVRDDERLARDLEGLLTPWFTLVGLQPGPSLTVSR